MEVDLTTDFGVFQASVPSGASKGKYEAVELRDGGKRYNSKGVLNAVKNVNEIIAPKLIGENPIKQKEIDNLMIKLDGTKNKSKLGANAILAVSMAVCRAGAAAKNLPLWKYISNLLIYEINRFPRPCFNVINGGLHAGNELDFQEFMIVPQVKPFSKALEMASEIYQELKNTISKRYGKMAANLGDEGGFAPPIRVPEEALDLILEAAKNLGYQRKIKIILDVAASQFFSKADYQMRIGSFTREGLLRYYETLVQKYPISGLEDPFSEDDWEGFKKITQKLGEKIGIFGDDLLATNIGRIKEAQRKKACNGIILKPNQVGTITETLEVAKLAKSFGWKIMVSHRSGETCDDFIADFAVGIGADFIKTGAPARGERMAKYNRLLRVEEDSFFSTLVESSVI